GRARQATASFDVSPWPGRRADRLSGRVYTWAGRERGRSRRPPRRPGAEPREDSGCLRVGRRGRALSRSDVNRPGPSPRRTARPRGPQPPGSTRRGKKIAHDWEAGGRHPNGRRSEAAGRRVPVEKVHVNVGTIGHIDHGKTTLTAAILAVQATK